MSISAASRHPKLSSCEGQLRQGEARPKLMPAPTDVPAPVEEDSPVARSGLVRAAAILVGFAGLLAAQRLTFEEYGVSQGLTNAAVNCIHQDSRGFLWVGTMSGLFRGDGLEFRHYGEADGLPNSTIQSIHEDGRGACG